MFSLNLNKRQILSQWMAGLFIFCILGVIGLAAAGKAEAASTTKKPTLTVSKKASEDPAKMILNVKASASAGIKQVKYETSYQKTSYFKKKGINLKLKNKKASVTVTKNGTYTFYLLDKAGNTTIKRVTVDTIDTEPPVIDLSYSVLNQTAAIQVNTVDLDTGISNVSYLKGLYTVDDAAWETAIDITGQSSFQTAEGGNYTIRAVDLSGNASTAEVNVQMELKGVWISYLEFSSKGYTKEAFTEYVNKMFDNVVSLNMNAVIVQVRMFSDAMYASEYFPWSRYCSGEQGVNPGFDPLAIMVEAAHERNLEIHAWLNPFRVTTKNTNLDTLADTNPAKQWLTDDDDENDRNVLTFDGGLYYNPASPEVHDLIVKGVEEIVTNYEVDGIHFDDYFYPTLGPKYASLFDSKEYKAYSAEQKAQGVKPESIITWRRNNVSRLVASVYQAIKEINPKVQFGISPAGNLNNLRRNDAYYVDIDKWLSSEGYVDYICPQLYWTFEHKTCAFDRLVDEWLALRTNPKVKMYVGIANYRAGSSLESQWKKSKTILADMVDYGRDTGEVDGYMFFRYEQFFKEICKPYVNELIPVLGKR